MSLREKGSVPTREPSRIEALYSTRSIVIKRLLDYLLGVPLLLLALPVMALIACSIKLVDRGPVLYVQEREGYRGRTIRLFKFRTMYVDSEERLQDFFLAHPESEAKWRTLFKLEEDPRIIPYIGEALRRSSLDELPNLWNLVRGDLTLVGPRPFPLYHVTEFASEFRALRQSVRPGLTGLWQIERGDIDAQCRWDTYYIEHWSLFLDLQILARTVMVMVKGKAYY